MDKPLPAVHEAIFTKTDQHLRGHDIFLDNISPEYTQTASSEKQVSTSDRRIPSNIVTRFLNRHKYGIWFLITAQILVALAITLGVLGGLGHLTPHASSSDLAVSGPSVGATKYPGTSNGTATPGHFDMSGSGDGTYYDPSVGITACGTNQLATDMVCALNYIDYGVYANPNDSPVCGACIEVTGPLGSAKVTIEDKCPGCGQGSLDLTPAVFSKIGDLSQGRIPVSWKPC
ncbi:hypothetical protein INT43_003355 [Umbelopsis isabellina]|uniref:RlpA-like protein double-psi beta-barrel domain-containing protein n=1 Tax=Mortierella isabellina TaxID=91625 RepID=A0A8H7UE06_MORIS|nr:hypothetical protein INT43_003355 [Umbelopsis isabellina]